MSVTAELRDEVMIATIDDGKANALTLEVVFELRDAVSLAIERRTPLVIVGRGGQFCAGFDLSVMRGGDRAAVSTLLGLGEGLFRQILEAPIPVIAACSGHALAGGALLLLSVDYRVGQRGDFKIGLNEVRIGMALPVFAAALAQHRLSQNHLTRAAILAEIASPERAVEFGLLDEVVEDSKARAIAVACTFAQYPTEAFAITKKRVRRNLMLALEWIHENAQSPK